MAHYVSVVLGIRSRVTGVVAAGMLLLAASACSSEKEAPRTSLAEAQRALCAEISGQLGTPPSVLPDSVLPRLEAVADLFEQAGDTKTASAFREVIAVQRSLNAASREKTALAVFLDDGVSPSQREAIEATLTQAEGVISVVYESKADAFEHFKEMFADSPEIVANVSADALPASFRLRISGPDVFDQVASLAGSMPGVDEVTTDLSGVANVPSASFRVTSRALAQCKSPGTSPSP